jgi:post-segregation antitoxin (ccd killing protein)
MGMEQLNIERDTKIEVQGYTVKFTPAENPTYSHVKLRKDGVVLETVILNKTGEVVDNIDVTDAPRELIQRAHLMKSEVAAIIKEALAIEHEEAKEFWSAPEAQRIAEASQIIAERNGDLVDD